MNAKSKIHLSVYLNNYNFSIFFLYRNNVAISDAIIISDIINLGMLPVVGFVKSTWVPLFSSVLLPGSSEGSSGDGSVPISLDIIIEWVCSIFPSL